MTKFKGSIAWTNIAYNNSVEQLNNSRKYYVSAVEYWREKNDYEQEKFFQDGLDLIDERIKHLRK